MPKIIDLHRVLPNGSPEMALRRDGERWGIKYWLFDSIEDAQRWLTWTTAREYVIQERDWDSRIVADAVADGTAIDHRRNKGQENDA